MFRNSLSCLLTVTILFTLPIASHAAFRCQGQLPGGMNKLDLLNYCGKPAYRDSYTKPIFIEGGEQTEYAGCETIDQWYYIDDETDSTVVLDIERGIVRNVRHGEKFPD